MMMWRNFLFLFFDSFIQQKREKFLAQKNFYFFAEQKAYAYFNSTKMLIKVGFVFDFVWKSNKKIHFFSCTFAVVNNIIIMGMSISNIVKIINIRLCPSTTELQIFNFFLAFFQSHKTLTLILTRIFSHIFLIEA